MSNRADIVNELTELNSPLKDMPAHTPYQVPDGYFNSLGNNLTNRINAKQNKTYDVPEGYFSKLPEAILNKAKQADVETPKEKTKVIDLRVSWRNFKLSAAAIILLFLSVGAYQMMSSTPQQTATVANKLEEVPDKLLLAYVQENIDDYDLTLLETNASTTTAIKTTTVENVSDDMIDEYLNNGWN